ncbi:hypothetical protein PSHT_06615 [Puccinia striiformis]|uniref:Uncharacterized protein n=1 Tax=Puccinia striiformis TaxID=27350 RepID=A0A2S4W474_9BASI|nr:hypothetical protein PSHT_06615 [Puccinia striiformis]
MMLINVFGLLYLSSNWHAIQASHIPFQVTRLIPRRFGKEQLNIQTIDGCPGEICGNFIGSIPSSLLAGADPCAAQDLADKIIDAAKTNPKITEGARKKMIEAAKTLAGAEHNVPPDSANGGKARKALHCLKPPKNSEIDGIVIKQDPAATGDEFFDPKTKKTVKAGEDPRTSPRGGGINGRKATEFTFIPEDKNSNMEKHWVSHFYILITISVEAYIQVFQSDQAFLFFYKDLSIITRSSCDKMLNCNLGGKKQAIFQKCKSLVDAVGKSKGDGVGADNWNRAWDYQQLQGSKSGMISGQIFGLLFLLSDWNFAQGSHIPLRVNRLIPRRFGKEHSVDVQIADCPGEVCGSLFGEVPGVLLAGADPCAAQDLADKIITKAKTDKNLKKNVADQLIEFGKALAGAEHNVPPDFTTNPPTPRKALHSQKLRAQWYCYQTRPGATDKFFDPKTKKTVLLGADERTRPRGGGSQTGDADKKPDGNDKKVEIAGPKGTGGGDAIAAPKIKFGGGINGRKATEFTFVTEDQTKFPHGEALATCDQLLNCKLDQKDEIFKKCKTLVEAVGKSKGDGAGADNWNSAVRLLQLNDSFFLFKWLFY